MRWSVFACAGKENFSPGSGARPRGMKASENPGCSLSSCTPAAHCRAIVGETMKPSAAYLMAGSKRSAKGSLPNFSESVTHELTAPGTVTDSHPRCGIAGCSLKRSRDHPEGERPDAFRP